MPATSYGYRSKNGVKQAIDSAVPGATSIAVLEDGAVRITYASALDSFAKESLDALMVARGFDVLPAGAAVMLGQEKICDAVVVTTETPAWQLVGTAFANPVSIAMEAAKAHGLIIGSYKSDGVTEIRVVEDDGASEVEVVVPTALADTDGVWSNALTLLTSVAFRDSRNVYRVEARIAVGAMLEFRSVLATLREWAA